MSSNLKVNSLVPATGTEIGIGTTGGSIDFRCPATFGGNVTIGGTLTYDEVINIDSIGVITARSNIDCNGSLDVDGHTNLDNVSVAGVSTFSGNADFSSGIDVTGNVTSTGNFVANGTMNVGSYAVFGAVVGSDPGSNYYGTTNRFGGGVSISGALNIDGDIGHIGDTDTKIRFPAADTFTVETGGVERLQLDATETTFNSTGADTDFRVRSPAQTHMFYVNAGTNQVSIKTSNAVSGAELTVNGRTHTDTQFTIGSNSTLDAGVQATIYKPATNTLAFATAGANERLRIDSNGRALFSRGGLTASRNVGTKTGEIQVSNTGNSSAITILAYSNDVSGPHLMFGKSRSTNATGNTIVQSGDRLGEIAFCGNDGSDFDSFGAAIKCHVDGTPGANDMPGRLQFYTTPDGGSTADERLRITSGGSVGINETSPAAQLHVENDNANGSTYYLNTDATVLIQNKNSNATAKTVLKLEGPVGGGDCAFVYGAGSTNMIFADRQNERLRIDSAGNVGMGTDVVSDSTGNARAFTIARSDANGQVRLILKNQATGFGNGAGFHHCIDGANAFIENRTNGGYIDFATFDSGGSYGSRARIDSDGISGTIKNNYTLVAFVSDRDDGGRSSGSNSYQDDTGLNLSSAITYKHGDIIFAEALCPGGIALTSTDTSNYQGVYIRIKITPSSGTTRYSNDTIAWYRNDGRATKETMQLTATHYHIQAGDSSTFNDNVSLSFQVQYKRGTGGTGSYGATGLSNWGGERTLKVWQFRKEL
jgi:hypothetical protein